MTVADALRQDPTGASTELSDLGRQLVSEVRGTRLADLAFNMIEIIDRNSYERSCDVRWWVTDSAMVDLCTEPALDKVADASKRLAVILSAYTVFLDLWVADPSGRVNANGRLERYTRAVGASVADEACFREAMASASGDDYAVADIAKSPALDQRRVATYAAAIREGAEPRGRSIGALGIFFDWEAQAQTVADGVRLSADEKARTRALLLDHDLRVIAASDRRGVGIERVAVETGGKPAGYRRGPGNSTIGFALTPGYETYRGLSWYGVLVQGV